mmetsp:Transcript_13087/g.19758  ORF Transcript_13087/g.19758 Transcript_13087/m.19758 type:complete len:450 (+) Transcript_13087:336-1685(+)
MDYFDLVVDGDDDVDDDDDDDENDNEKDEEEKSEQESRQRLNNRRHATSDGDREAFLNLLKENNVKSRFDWKLILSSKHLDPRYQAIHPSERRKLFDQYIDEQYRLKRAKEIESLNKKKVSFMEMLDAQQLSLDARYIDVFKLIEHDKRMEDIDDEYLRLSYFDEYLDRKVRDHMEAQRKEEDLAKSQFTTLLETRYKQGWFSSESSWVDMKKKLLEANEHSLHESLAFEAWCEFQTKLSQQDLVQSRKQAKEKYYRALLWHELIKYHNHGVITCNSQFVDFEKIANSQIKLSKMINLVDHQDGPNAKHLFTAYREDLEDEYNIHRTMLHNILLGYKYMFVSTTTFDQFLSAIGRGAREQIPPCNLQIYFSEFTRHVQKLDRQKFFDYLKSIPKDTPLSDIQFDTLDHLKQKWYDEFHSGTIEGMVPRQRDSHPDDEEDVAPPLKKFKS